MLFIVFCITRMELSRSFERNTTIPRIIEKPRNGYLLALVLVGQSLPVFSVSFSSWEPPGTHLQSQPESSLLIYIMSGFTLGFILSLPQKTPGCAGIGPII